MQNLTRDIGILFIVLFLLTMLWRRMSAHLEAPVAHRAAVSRASRFPAGIDRQLEAPRPIDLRQLLLEMPQDCLSLLQPGHVSLRQSAPRGPLCVDARREELRHLLAHVASIACLAMPRGGVLNVLAMADGPQVLVEFMDVGIGGQEPLLAALFLHGSQAPRLPHGGLGADVACCRRIVEAHGGHIEAAPSVWGGLGLAIRLPLLANAALAD